MLICLSAHPAAAVEIATPHLRLAMTVVVGGWPHFARLRWLFRITPWNGHDRSLRLFVRKAENSPASFCIDAIYKHSKL